MYKHTGLFTDKVSPVKSIIQLKHYNIVISKIHNFNHRLLKGTKNK